MLDLSPAPGTLDASAPVGGFRLGFEGDAAWFVFDRATLEMANPPDGGVGADYTRALDPFAARLTNARLIADLQDVPVIDSIRIGMLLALSKACRPFGRLRLAHVSDGVARLLKVTYLDRFFELVDDAETPG